MIARTRTGRALAATTDYYVYRSLKGRKESEWASKITRAASSMQAIGDASMSPSIEAHWWATDLRQAALRCVGG